MILVNKRRVSLEELALISENIAELHDNGVNFIKIMELIEEMELTRGYKKAIDECKESILKGETLYTSFSKNNDLFPSLFLELLSLGEQSGELSKVMEDVSSYYKKMDEVKKELKKEMTYPLTVLITSVIVFIIFVFGVLPAFSDILLLNTGGVFNYLLSFRSFVINNPLDTFIYTVCFGSIAVLLIKDVVIKKGKYHLVKLKIYRERIEYLIILLLDIILSSGVNIQKGLTFYKDGGGMPLLSETMEELSYYIYKGYKIHDALKLTGIFSNYSLSIIKAGEEGGLLAESVHKLTIVLEKKTKTRFDKVLRNITPFMTIAMGGVIGIFLVNFFSSFLNMLMGGISGR